ncbi:MAG TPA: WYL domain-containing protein, partial [bacterium]|nr:WYL domain-containing protein [bacterium]
TLATELEVSPRTVYRDIADLMASGIPVSGEAGMGYLLGKDLEMPPLALNAEEVEALVMGGRMVRAWAGADMAKAASSALTKIEASLPESKLKHGRSTSFYAPRFPHQEELTSRLKPLRDACRKKQKLGFEYRSLDGHVTRRTVRPLSLVLLGRVWILAAWCEDREDFRSFQVDRISQLRATGRFFKEEPGKTLKDMIAREQAKAGVKASPLKRRTIKEKQMTQENLKLAEAYVSAMGRHDLEALEKTLHPQLHFKGPLEEADGRERFLETAKKLFALLKGVEVKAKFENQNETLFIYDMRFPEPMGLSRAFNWMTFEDGKIKTSEVLYDARPFEKFFANQKQ